ncbi:pyridoxal phosphate biosynthesis PdxJ family protein [Candidatus Endolissoclinum faulkneri L2]|uniref:Pyridoxine 5'-phosphate synthase n=1 Tax=Candidatus Endolissoclinum faulkneri L2 TaxID=1193729 RepID=K7YL88_9PROT|nr:pyridoxine 5'-phosphate synthase [Candidatus Endolissoclinum faulkneri]AFX98252.1 pyridoxal phosphate biosynthesis PdxJ family protein [Candidatus Endolissoclinum faulkneri L2]
MIALSVNLNKVATLRNTRTYNYPSVVRAARTVLDAGAAGITIHPRPDARHILEEDVLDLAELMKEPSYSKREFNIEGYPDARFLALVKRIKPNQVTLVPDTPSQLTSDHGWNLLDQNSFLFPIVAELKSIGCRVSLFSDAEPDFIEEIAKIGSDRIEIYTGYYFNTFDTPQNALVLKKIADTAKAARNFGLGINAGHDLTLKNLPTLVKSIPWIDEVSIGHHFIGEALWMGLEEAVWAYNAKLVLKGT